MAVTIYEFQCLIPFGTAKATPAAIPMAFPVYQVDRVEIKVPHGNNGTMGFWIGSQGQQIIPYTTGTFVITDDEEISWDLTDYPTSGSWELVGYNTGSFNHTVYVRFLVTPVDDGSAAPGLVLPSSVLSSS